MGSSFVAEKKTSLIFLTSSEIARKDLHQAECLLKSYIRVEYITRKMSLYSCSALAEYDGYDNEFITWIPQVPRQNNEHDCGVFVLQYAEDLLKDIYTITTQITVSRVLNAVAWICTER
eukprot:TRINITY_DN8701_c0_g1_i2.p1 TRINITY_DN8701_c0_g1~~TRINITY_DN8701_c0_g1_i2.p1  ORF type:complete len:119 (+),score=12.96 TRINITY_DN8701_c0_g1_i2:446-802(+)